MSTLTEHLQLIKPDGTDNVSPQPYNQNFDKIDTEINALKTDYVVAQGEQDGWIYRRWDNGIVEQWKTSSQFTVNSKNSVTTDVPLPVSMKSSDYNVQLTLTTLSGGNVLYWTWISLLAMQQTVSSFKMLAWNDSDHNVTIAAHIYIIGRWK